MATISTSSVLGLLARDRGSSLVCAATIREAEALWNEFVANALSGGLSHG